MWYFSCFKPISEGEIPLTKIKCRRDSIFIFWLAISGCLLFSVNISIYVFYVLLCVIALSLLFILLYSKMFNCPYCDHNLLYKLPSDNELIFRWSYASLYISDCCSKCKRSLIDAFYK